MLSNDDCYPKKYLTRSNFNVQIQYDYQKVAHAEVGGGSRGFHPEIFP